MSFESNSTPFLIPRIIPQHKLLCFCQSATPKHTAIPASIKYYKNREREAKKNLRKKLKSTHSHTIDDGEEKKSGVELEMKAKKNTKEKSFSHRKENEEKEFSH